MSLVNTTRQLRIMTTTSWMISVVNTTRLFNDDDDNIMDKL